MSIARKIKVNYSLSAIEAECIKLGLNVQKNVKASEIYGAQHIEGYVDLAIGTGQNFLIGIRKSESGTEVILDSYEQTAPKLMANILTSYFANKVAPYYSVDEVAQTRTEVVLTLKR